MLTLSAAFYRLKEGLLALYDGREAAAIAHEVMGHLTGLGKMDRLMEKDSPLPAEQQLHYEHAYTLLMAGTPVQYVTGSAWFMSREYRVNDQVLIPRPETEELVQWIVDDQQQATQPLSILDIGTGSGCIPISLQLALAQAKVSSVDISPGAIEVAKGNAEKLNANVELMQLDILDPAQYPRLGLYDVIVSNPPYIPLSEKERLHTNVSAHEPGLALFVPDEDALVFYRAIAHLGRQHLNSNGYIYCELDAAHAEETKELFAAMGYDAAIRKDMHGNWRMLKARRQA